MSWKTCTNQKIRRLSAISDNIRKSRPQRHGKLSFSLYDLQVPTVAGEQEVIGDSNVINTFGERSISTLAESSTVNRIVFPSRLLYCELCDCSLYGSCVLQFLVEESVLVMGLLVSGPLSWLSLVVIPSFVLLNTC